MDNKIIGIVIIIISIVLFFVLTSFATKLDKISTTQCPCPAGGCPMESALPIEVYVGFVVVLILISIGSFLILKTKQIELMNMEDKEKIEKIIRILKGDERKVYETITESGGALFQAEVVEKTGFNKVKASRTLDKLEGKGLIERRRRGMTNLVLIKR
ncbi:MAG: hypothetical protein KKF74_04825 [Nanoarchaeota archaeon]|nr:hypothetical protein [Nanoarchaeota archaeon]